jgi:AraC-like DNA-binding protein
LKNLINIGEIINCEHIDSHSHTVWEMVYYTKGKVNLTVNEKEYQLSEGVFVCQPPFLSHSEKGVKTFDNYYFNVSNYDLLPNKLIIVEDTVNKVIKYLVQEMYYTFNTRPANYSLMCEAQLNLIVQYVISKINPNNLINPYVEKFTLMLLSNASNCNFRISEIESSVPFSFDYFRLLFKKEMGCTPIDYLNKIRISNAKNLLINSFYQDNLSIATISKLCGFLDPLYFSRSFKNHTGMSPSGWLIMNKAGI